MFHIMSYDYAVSDITSQSVTSPNAPLYNPDAKDGAVAMSINQSVAHYLAAGVPKEKMMIGLPLYAHTWYVPGLQGDAWKTFGQKSTNQGECCGPFKPTMGAKPGQGCQLCGSMMYSEILAAKPAIFEDPTTKSTIGYMTSAGADSGYTEAGTWLSYNDVGSIQAVAAYEQAQGLAGMFVYSADMDTKDYALMNAVADAIGKAPGPSPPHPSPGPPTPPGPAPAGVPTCAAANQAPLCQISCASNCRGFPPGFASPGCIDASDCTNPPAWAKKSVCSC